MGTYRFSKGDVLVSDLNTGMEILGTESDNCDKSRDMYVCKINGRFELRDARIVEKYYTKK